MTGARLELANPHAYESPKAYIEQHLAPLVTELHRITNELTAPSATSLEETATDMVPSNPLVNTYASLDVRLDELPKQVTFDGSAHLLISRELLRQKQLKVQLSATVYVKGHGDVMFRLIRDDGVVVTNSHMPCGSVSPETIVRILPFGEQPNCIAPLQHRYILQGKGLDLNAIPVCRRFSLSFVYI